MNRNTLLFAALVLLLLAGPVVWLTWSDPAAPRRPAPPAAKGRGTESTGQRHPRGSRAAEAEPAAEPPADRKPAPAAAAPAEPAPPPLVVLHCRLEGLDADVPPANTVVVVELAGVSRGPSVRFDGGAADHFDVDVSPLLPEDKTSADLAITAERHGYLTATESVSVWARRDRQGTETRAVVLHMHVAGWVSGIVQDDRFERVAGADVGAWVPFKEDWIPVDRTSTDDDGVFRLRLRPDEMNLVVVAAPARKPASAQLTGVARAESELAPFTLQPGLAISGSLRSSDGKPIADATVVATPIWAKTDMTLARHRLAYRGGLIFESPASAPVKGGEYVVDALVPGDYDVTVSARGFAPDLLDMARRRASPPAEHVDLVLDPARVVVQVTCDGRPVPRVKVPMRNVDGVVVGEVDGRGASTFFVKPGTDYEIEIQPEGFEKFRRSFSAPPAGAETTIAIDLRRRIPWPKLVLRLAAEDAEGDGALESADVVLFLGNAVPPTPPERSQTVVFSTGAGTLDGLFAGSYRVVVSPRGPGYRLPLMTRVRLYDGDTARADLRFFHGGRIRIAVRDPAGAPAVAKWRVLADERDDQFAAGEAGSDVEPLLSAGRYRVVVTPPGGEPVTVRATVVADTTVDALVTVVAPRKAD